MSFLRNLTALVVALAMAAVGVLFALQNPEPIALDILVMQLPPRSLALWVLSALAIGGIVGLMLSTVALLRLRARLGSMRRRLARAEGEVERLRANRPQATGLVTRE